MASDKLDWKTLLRDRITSCAKNLPGIAGEEINIAVGVDTSGSISDEDIRMSSSEIKGIFDSYDEYTIHLFFEYINELKSKGFKIYAPEKLTTYCNFVKEDKIGYVECSDWGFNFCTVHKPCRECGTGFSVYREIFDPAPQMAEDCFIFAPDWATPLDLKAVHKYANIEEFLAERCNNEYIEY